MTIRPSLLRFTNEDAEPFFLIVIDEDREVFCIEGPLTDDRPWRSAPRTARDHHYRVVCGRRGADRDALASELRSRRKLTGVPPGSIVRPAIR